MAGWHNVISPTTGTNNYFTFSDGNTYPVQVTGFRPNGNGFDNADNSPGALMTQMIHQEVIAVL